MKVLGVNLVILFDKRVRYVKKVKNHCKDSYYILVSSKNLSQKIGSWR